MSGNLISHNAHHDINMCYHFLVPMFAQSKLPPIKFSKVLIKIKRILSDVNSTSS